MLSLHKVYHQTSNMANEDREIKNSAALRSLSGDLGLLNKTDGSACFSHGMANAIVQYFCKI